jgi:CRISPR system Cascade subunit CasC
VPHMLGIWNSEQACFTATSWSTSPCWFQTLAAVKRIEWKSQPEEIVKDTRDVLERLIEAIATVSPGAKLGATAPYSRAALVLLEAGESQPRTLANAFLEALKPTDDVMMAAVDKMGDHLKELDGMYGQAEKRFVASLKSTDSFGKVPKATLQESTKSVLDAIWGAS